MQRMTDISPNLFTISPSSPSEADGRLRPEQLSPTFSCNWYTHLIQSTPSQSGESHSTSLDFWCSVVQKLELTKEQAGDLIEVTRLFSSVQSRLAEETLQVGMEEQGYLLKGTSMQSEAWFWDKILCHHLP